MTHCSADATRRVLNGFLPTTLASVSLLRVPFVSQALSCGLLSPLPGIENGLRCLRLSMDSRGLDVHQGAGDLDSKQARRARVMSLVGCTVVG
ncbi:hypothetical protein BJ165DRAFT_1446014 [Panaeolus papilionaceus]|nr:hypothetical protein BJ165DRAFT_1446014 [Panaeolus papilionaceus]